MTTKGELTRARIVAAASDLMSQQGVSATRLQDVQAAAGVGPSQIYHYFTDKSALVRAVISYRDGTVVGGQEATLAEVGSLAELRVWADAVVGHQERLHCRGGCPIGSLSSELAEVDDDAREEVVVAFERWAGALGDSLRRIADAGALGDLDPDDVALTLLATAQGGLLLGQARRDTRPLRVALHQVIDLVEASEAQAPRRTAS